MSGQDGWVKVEISVATRHLDAATGLLWDLGASGVEIQDDTTMQRVSGTRAVAYFGGEPVEDLRIRTASAVPARWNCQVSVAPFTDESWKENWKQFFKPVQVSPRLGVRPPWEPRPGWDPAVQELVVEPGLAFGTGTHATTQLCLAWIDDLFAQHTPASLLDVGCGSGILSIAAAKLSDSTIIRCLDVDPEARRVTAENALDNGVADRVQILDGVLGHNTGHAEFVVANILAHILVQLQPDLTRAVPPGGQLLLSGIGQVDEASVVAAFGTQMQQRGRREKDGWVALLFIAAPVSLRTS
jgi:ribosomal protein L11 methyltransferase